MVHPFVIAIWFLGVAGLGLVLWVVRRSRGDRLSRRLAVFSTPAAAAASTNVPRRSSQPSRSPDSEVPAATLKTRLVQAGIYHPASIMVFQIIRVLLALLPPLIGWGADWLEVVPFPQGTIAGLLGGTFGYLIPSFWLDFAKRRRQLRVRRSLPDAMDVLVICLEGGLSLTGALSRVAGELAVAHPMLTVELRIVEREIRMGRTAGQAMRRFADRFDLEELRSMSSIIAQAERLGSSVITALNVFADTLRHKRQERAEELAHKASVKMVFPTVLFIFPGIFVVILGPAAIIIYKSIVQSSALG